MIVFDAVAKSSYAKTKKVLTDSGRYVSTVPSPSPFLLQATNFTRRKKAFWMFAKANHDDLDFVVDLANQRKINVAIDKAYKLDEAAEAHRHIETERVRGELVIKMEH